MRKEITYKNGLRDGKTVLYHISGKVAETCDYADGLATGEQLSYTLEGQVIMKETYKKGKLDGETVLYTMNGNPLEIITYKNGGTYRYLQDCVLACKPGSVRGLAYLMSDLWLDNQLRNNLSQLA